MRPVVAAVIGAASALGEDVLAQRRVADRRVALTAAALVGAATIYPLGRRGFGDRLERLTLAASVVLVGASAALPSARGRQLVAAGWLAHAGFDAAFAQRRGDSRIPTWYPPMCAGYDAMVAVRLATG